MLSRTVEINGTLYDKHEVTRLDVRIGGSIQCNVKSTTSDGAFNVSRTFALPYEDGAKLAGLEAKLWVLPAFEEYDDTDPHLDEVLEILTDEQAVVVPDAFQKWKPNTEYKVGDRRNHEGVLYKCLQAHTSQEDYSPDKAASLWARMLNPDPEVIPVWEQPDSTNPYMIGDKVHYPTIDDPVYESTIDNNVYSPEAYPQGWQLVEGGE